jgi:hypothetical protein
MRYTESRRRSQGLTIPETPLDTSKTKPNGVWGPWTKWAGDKNDGPFLIEVEDLKKENGLWSKEVGDGLQPFGAGGKLSQAFADSGRTSPYYLTIEQIVGTKPSSCDATFSNSPPERAPGHFAQRFIPADKNNSRRERFSGH